MTIEGLGLVWLLAAVTLVLYLRSSNLFIDTYCPNVFAFMKTPRKLRKPPSALAHSKPVKSTVFLFLLLASAGDIHPNPGPRTASITLVVCVSAKCPGLIKVSPVTSATYGIIARVWTFALKTIAFLPVSFPFRCYEVAPSFYEPVSADNFSQDSFQPFSPLMTSSLNLAMGNSQSKSHSPSSQTQSQLQVETQGVEHCNVANE